MKQHVKGECKDLSSCKSKVCLKRHPKVCKRLSVEKFCKFGASCAYFHIPDTNLQVKEDKKSQSDLKIILLEDEMKMIKSQLRQLGLMTRELRDKVELVDIEQVSNINVTETLKQSSENRTKEKYKVKPKVTKTQKYNCNQCNCTFKKDITLQKHKNMRHGQPHKVDIVTVSEKNLNETPKLVAGNKVKHNKANKPKAPEILKFKCDQCNDAFKKGYYFKET